MAMHARPRRRCFALLLIVLCLAPAPLPAQNQILVDGTLCTLSKAIGLADVANGVDTVAIGSATTEFSGCPTIPPSNPLPPPGPYTLLVLTTQIMLTSADNYWYGPNALPPIASDITIAPATGTLRLIASHTGDPAPATADAFRFFYVSGGLEIQAGSLTLRDVVLEGGYAKGGDSQYGGGGAGLGGAIFNQGALSLVNVSLVGNIAHGGNIVSSGYSGGGGMGRDADGTWGGFGPAAFWQNSSFGGAGGSGFFAGGGGGGFVAGSDGGSTAIVTGGNGGGLGLLGGAGSAGDLGAPLPAGAAGDGGGGGGGAISCGDAKAVGRFGVAGGSAFCGGGNGGGIGGGGGAGVDYVGTYDGAGGGGFGGGGGSSRFGAGGGFGGGGAGGSTLGGASGFGAGAGGTFSGGGGTGMGGAIFNHTGTVSLLNVTATGNAAQGGIGVEAGGDGSGLGAVLFNLNGDVTIDFSTLAGNFVSGNNAATDDRGPEDATVYSIAYGNKIQDGTASAASLTIHNSIIHGTHGDGGNGDDILVNVVDGTQANSSTVIYKGKNFVQFSTNVGNVSQTGTSPAQADPLLGALSLYASSSSPQLPLLPLGANTPAQYAAAMCFEADATTQLLTDARGALRPYQGMCTLGAYQFDGDYIFAANYDAVL